MTDLEMNKLCADAMGIKTEYCFEPKVGGEEWLAIRGTTTAYDPIHDDAQAMALLKTFCLDVNLGIVITFKQDFSSTASPLNRAIVECVAHMQKAKG